MSDKYMGSYHDAYDGKSEVSIAFVIKHRVSAAVETMYKYLDNKCKIRMNDCELVGTPYIGKMTKNKYVLSVIFPKADNPAEEGENPIMRKLAAMATMPNVAMEIEVIEESGVKRVDPQFWEKIKKTLRDMAAYSGSAEEWDDFRAYVKAEYGLKFTVGPLMESAEAELFYDAAIEYAGKNQIPLRSDEPMLKDIEGYITACRKENKCCVCGAKVYDSSVYPVCQDHYDELIERGKTSFDHKHKF